MAGSKVRPEAAGTRSPLWGQPSFLKLWAGQSVSLMGSAVTGLALPLTAIYVLHVNAAQIGLLKTLQWMPYLVISLYVGAWSDRHRRRPLMIAANLGQAIMLGVVVALALSHALTLPVMFVAVFVIGTLTVFFDVSYTSYIPAIVSTDDLLGANSRLQSSSAVAQLGGPALGGLLVQLFTAPLALLADAISFVISVVSLLWIGDREPAPVAQPGEGGVVAQIRAGLAVVLKEPVLRALVVTSACYNLFSQWIVVLFLLFAVRDLGMSAGVIGLISSGAAVGALLGSLSAGILSRKFRVGRTFMACVIGECGILLAVPFVPAGHVAIAAVMLAVAFGVSGSGSAISSIAGISIRLATTPTHLIGRMTATYRFISFGVVAIGALCGGFAGQELGLRTGLLVGAIGIQCTIVWVAFSPLPRLRDLTAPAAPAAPAAPDELSTPDPADVPRDEVMQADQSRR